MSDITRRQALAQLAAAFAAAGAIDHLTARNVHAAAQQAAASGPYTPRALSAQQFRTLEKLTDLIIPVENGKPGALQAGVPAWIDQLLNVNADLKGRYVTGLSGLDAAMQTQHQSEFAGATPAQQTEVLDAIAKQKTDFFVLARRMTVDGFYTSAVGTRDINPSGRPPHATYVVPKEDVDFVMSRSPFK
jgi:hypothetical protein